MADRPSRHIVIAGAGIAGLTLALALAKHGMQITVLERRDRIEEFGAGLQIGPNARRALNALNLDSAVSKVSFEPQAIDLLPFGSKGPLAALTLGDAATERYGAPYAVMHRGDLAELLHTACRRFANIDVRFGVSDFDVAVTDDTRDRRRVTVTAKIGGDKPFKAHPFAFIGADGVGSRTRTALLGGPEATYSGYAAWRALIDNDKLKNVIDLNRTSLMFGSGFHAVAYPLHHRNTTNVALFTEEKLSLTFGIRTQPSLPPKVNRDPRLAAILSHADWKHWPLAMVDIPSWHRGPIGLIGDAAHAMLPFQAQGAAMGIEDALILASLLAHAETPDAAFGRFEIVRRRRVKRVADASSRNGQIFHMSQPLSRARDLVMKAQGATSHFKRLDWLYSYDPLAESPQH